MAITDLISALDAEINRLQQARSILASLGATSLHSRAATKSATGKRKRKMSAEARKRIGDAQRKRWAKQKAPK
jgi:hypothetical protein